MCDHHLADGPLVCIRTTPHDPPHGCQYESTSGVPGHPEPQEDE